MDIIDIIVRDHDAVFALIHAMQDTLEPESFRRVTAKKQAHAIVTELQIHLRRRVLEREQAGVQRELFGARVFEHKAIDDAGERLIKLVDNDSSARVDIIAQLTVLREILEHHAREEEEKDLLPEVKKLFAKADREAMGGEMESLRMALTKGPAPLRAEAVLVG